MKNEKIYYYYHPESGELWMSNKPPVMVVGTPSDIQEIDKEEAEKIATDQEIEVIPLIND
jgi:hypothetical protein